MEQKLLLARQFALDRHGNQKYGAQPYIYHLDQVVALLQSVNASPAEQIAGYLHDVLEDTATTLEELTALFGVGIARLVRAVSGIGINRVARKRHILLELEKYPQAINLKLADRYINMHESALVQVDTKKLKMYAAELSDYEPLFRQANPMLWARMLSLVAIVDQILKNT